MRRGVGEGYVQTPEHRKNSSIASLKREASCRRQINVDGVVYGNLTRAEKGTGISARTLARHAVNEQKPNIYFVENSK